MKSSKSLIGRNHELSPRQLHKPPLSSRSQFTKIQSACHESSPQRGTKSHFPSSKQRNADVDASIISKFASVFWRCQARLGKMAPPVNHSAKRDTSSLIHRQWVTHKHTHTEEAGSGSLLFTSAHFDSFNHHSSLNSHFLFSASH